MRICVFGAGAVGGHLAAKLAARGNDVSVVARGAHLEAMRAKGIVLQHGREVIAGKVKASERSAPLGAQDFVLVSLKANLLAAFAEQAKPLLGPDTGVVFVQNGIPWWYAQGVSAQRQRPPDLSFLDPGGLLARAVAPERVIGAVVFSANDVIEPGVIQSHTPGNNMLCVGEADDRRSARIAALREALTGADLHSPPVPDIRQVMWSKLVINLGTSTLAVLAEATVREMVEDRALSELRQRARRGRGDAHARRAGAARRAQGGGEGPLCYAPMRAGS